MDLNKKLKPGQLFTVDNCVYRVIKDRNHRLCIFCSGKENYNLCKSLPTCTGIYFKRIK